MAKHSGYGTSIIGTLIVEVILIVILADLVSGDLGTTLYTAVNTTFGPIGASIMLLIAQVAMALTVLAPLLGLVQKSMQKIHF